MIFYRMSRCLHINFSMYSTLWVSDNHSFVPDVNETPNVAHHILENQNFDKFDFIIPYNASARVTYFLVNFFQRGVYKDFFFHYIPVLKFNLQSSVWPNPTSETMMWTIVNLFYLRMLQKRFSFSDKMFLRIFIKISTNLK